MSKEKIHDEKISPLMDQIIGVCQEAGIACLCLFDISSPEDVEPWMCTTILNDGDGKASRPCLAAFHASGVAPGLEAQAEGGNRVRG